MNRERLLGLMRDHGVRAVVAATPENVCYLTGHVGWAQHVYRDLPCVAAFTDDDSPGTDLVVPRSDTPYLAATASGAQHESAYGGRAALLDGHPGEAPSVEQARFSALHDACAQHPSPAHALAALLRDRGVNSGTVVVDTFDAGAGFIDGLRIELPDVELVEGPGLLLLSRLVKTDDELSGLARAADLNEVALQSALAIIAPGITELDVARVWRAHVSAAGGKPLWFHLGTGSRSAYVFPPTDAAFTRGDRFVVDGGLVFDGYVADAGTCGSIGEPTTRASIEWDSVLRAFDDAAAVLAAGVRGSDVYAAMQSTLGSGALADARVPFAGHTIGFEAREFPFVLGKPTIIDQAYLPPTSDIPLPAGATVNIEVPVGRLGDGGYQIEKTFVIEADGSRELIETVRDMYVVAG